MAGYYFERAAEGVHDDLYAKALVIEYESRKVALVALDLISTQRGFVEEARRLIAERTGIPSDHIMISATHAHTGPVLSDRSSRSTALGGGNDLAMGYLRALPDRIAASVEQANTRLAPSKISAAIGDEPSLPFNRRFHMRDGTVGWNPGRMNPKVLRPAGPIDPSVPVVLCESTAGQARAIYVNYTMHLDMVGGLEISADYPHTLSKLLAALEGESVVTLFTIGTAGDINHVNVQWRDQPKGQVEAARIGTVLAAAVVRTFPHLEPLGPARLQARHEMVPLPLPEIDLGEVEKAREIIRRRERPESQQPTFLESVHAFKVVDVYERQGRPQQVEVQVITVGSDLAWVSLPGEIFVELGLAIKQASPFQYTIIAELANGSIGCIPTRQAYTQGNYEVVSARCAAGSGELLVEAASRLLREAHQAMSSAERGAAADR